jgi:hypothetical protein
VLSTVAGGAAFAFRSDGATTLSRVCSHVTEGFTFLTIYDASTDAVVFSDQFLDPSSTDALILAGTLLPDTTYDYELDFSDRLNGYDRKHETFTVQGFDLPIFANDPKRTLGVLLAQA